MPDLRFHHPLTEKVQPAHGALAAALVGLALSAIAFFAVSAWEDRAAERSFASLAEEQIRTLQAGIDNYVSRLASLRAFFNATDENVTRSEFETFTNELMKDQPGLLSMSWTPRVLLADRAAHELAAQNDGIIGYRISAIDEKGDKAGAAPERDDYYPVFYSTQPHRSPSYGIDLQDGGVRQRPLDMARDNDTIAATENFRLQTGMVGHASGFYAVLPVYRQGEMYNTLESRRRNIRGFVRCTFQFHLIADAVLSGVRTPVKFFLFEADADATNLPVYVRKNGAMSDERFPRSYVMSEPLKWVGDLRVADRRWEAVVVPNGASSLVRHNRAWIVLAAGLAITSILAFYAWTSIRYVRMLEAANAAILEQALTEPLTGLANRRHFVERLTEAFASADRTGDGFALHFMDLDGFKMVNDSRGHPMGDALLQEVAQRLRTRVREIDFVARFGGDEFAILQTLVDSPIDAMGVAEKLVQAISAPYLIGGVELNVTASVGIALSTPQVEGPTSLMMQADLALYTAKAAGRNCVRIYGSDFESCDVDASAGRTSRSSAA